MRRLMVLMQIGFAVVLVITSLMFGATVTAAEQYTGKRFDHVQTGYPLLGAHAQADCQTCHLQGVFKGTPRDCAGCHTQGSRIASTFKTTNHPLTAMPCNQCHTSQVSWAGARFDHIGVAPGSCITCHNGVTATGKPARHVVTNASCDLCHRTTSWIPAGFDHTGVAPGSCETCHIIGGIGTPRPGGTHPPTGSCDACHSTRNWSFLHAGVLAGTCNTCHGVTATGKNARHIPTTLSCDACHITTRPFSFETFNHQATQGIVTGQCSTCHTGGENGIYNGARGPKVDTAHTTPAYALCDDCHTTNNWDSNGPLNLLPTRSNKPVPPRKWLRNWPPLPKSPGN